MTELALTGWWVVVSGEVIEGPYNKREARRRARRRPDADIVPLHLPSSVTRLVQDEGYFQPYPEVIG